MKIMNVLMLIHVQFDKICNSPTHSESYVSTSSSPTRDENNIKSQVAVCENDLENMDQYNVYDDSLGYSFFCSMWW